MKRWKWLIMIIVIVAGVAILIADAGRGESYASLAAVREDIAFYQADVLKEVTFEDHIVFFITENRKGPSFYWRVFEEKENGEYQQVLHSAMISEGMTMEQEWRELWNKTYLIRFCVQEEGTEPFEFLEDNWNYACRDNGAGWDFSYEILKKEGFGEFVPVEIQ